MKQQQPIRALGFYHDDDGLWQRAVVLSDGVDVLDMHPLERTETPVFESCDLIGIGSVPDRMPPCDPARLAAQSGVTVISDLRHSDLSLGGRGTPLSPFYLHALARSIGGSDPVAFLRLEGKASVVWVDPAVSSPTAEGAVMAYVVGPALDALSALHAQRPQGNFQGGKVVDGALELFLDEPYFRRMPPKWIGAQDFEQMLSLVYELGDADAEATLCGMTATAILLATEHFPKPTEAIVAYGTGAGHEMLMRLTNAGLSHPVLTADAWGLAEDSLGAQTTAFLAIRAKLGLPTTGPMTTGVSAAVGGGTQTRP